MIPVSIGSASRLYETASKCQITRHWLDHAGLADVSRSLRALVQTLGAEVEDEFWQRTLSPVRRLVFAFCSTPLPFDRATAAVSIEWDKLNLQVRRCQQLYPDSHAALASVVQKLQSLGAETVSPFTAVLESLHSSTGGMSVVLRNPRMNQATSAHFADSVWLRNARVVSARQLREAYFCDVLVALGPCAWFPDYVFTAPRAAHIHVVCYSWIRDPWKPGPVFLNGSYLDSDTSCKHLVGALPKLVTQSPSHISALSDLRPLELLPPLPPFGKHASHAPEGHNSGCAREETLPARLCHLSGDRAVFVSADEGASTLVIDTSETGDSVVRRVPAGELEPELCLLLRTSGGGDFITALADRMLGDQAAERRVQQAGWKAQLLTAAQMQFGALSRRELASRVAAALCARNMTRTQPANVHYWLSTKCIRPRKKEDFAAMLSFAGIAGQTEELWKAMTEIDRAHKCAGQAIRRMLLQKIATSSLEQLERDGEMVFDLGEQDGGTLTAFQITGISSEEFEVSADRIGVLLDSER